jgi:ATP-binding cassette subfamily B protein/subfamily B ATP-binding cassette protein MsbA
MRPAAVLEAMAAAEKQRAQNRGAVARRLAGELRPWRPQLTVAFALVAVGAIAQAAGPWFVSRAIDRDLRHHDGGGLLLSLLAMLGVYVVGALAQAAQMRRIGDVGQELLASIRERLFVQLQALPLGYFDRRPVGDLMSRLLGDVDTLGQLLTMGITQLLGSLFALVGIMGAMLILNPLLALSCFSIIPIMLYSTRFFAARARARFRKTRETVGNVTANLQEEIVGVRQAQAFNRTEVNIERFRARNAANRDANVSAVGVTSAFPPFIDVLSTLSVALIIGFGGWQIAHGQLTVGLLAAFLIYVQGFFRPVQLAASVYTQLQSALAGSERIYAILDERREPDDVADATSLDRARGAIAFEHVSFAYTPDGKKVLDDVSFDVAAGQTVALVGKTGAGKTTIASLIPRFYDATLGAVKLDGHDVRAIARRSLRAQMAMVLQEPFLFSGTLAENISYGRPSASRAEIEQAAKAARVHDFIAALPAGYDTPLGEAGGTLSQGQKQLVAFARAILAEPRVLILDEATANIDTRTEQLIQAALAQLLAGRTSVVIAHRLSTIRHADQILVIDGGKIAEAGRHEDLLAAGGVYAELHKRQFRE